MSNRKIMIIGLIAIACLGLALLGRMVLTHGNARNNPANAPSEMVAAMKTHFPEEWKQMERTRKQSGANDTAIGAAFIQSKLPDIARAPDAALIAIIEAESALARQLQSENTQACANFIMVGPTDANTYSKPSQVLLDKAAARTVIAARQGIDAPVTRNIDPPTAMARLQFAMHDQGVPQRLMEPDPANPLTPAEQCQFGVRLYDALTTLPAPEAAEIFTNIKFAAR